WLLPRRSCLGEPDKPFFLLNSDIVCEYPLKEVLSFHQAHGGEASIMVTKVAEPSKYGVVLLDEESGQVKEFVEKPPVFVGNRIDAGVYLPSIDVLSRVLPRLRLLERQVFPSIAAREACTLWFMLDFWMDMGQPKDYLAGLRFCLDYVKRHSPSALAAGQYIIGKVLVDGSAKVGEEYSIGGRTWSWDRAA
ncbi:unnamed protein product, partial [Musa banksii]